MYEIIAFIFFSVLTLGMFLVTVFSKNVLYSMSSLAGGMIFISGFFFLLDAEFLGVVQLLVYTGAVMALYAFGMMFFDSVSDVKESITCKKLIYTMWIVSALLIIAILVAPIYSADITPFVPNEIAYNAHIAKHQLLDAPIIQELSNAQRVGQVLFTKYLLPFELAAIMLLVAMISGIVLVSKRMDKSESLNDNGFIIKEELV